ncbi:DUF1015 domain-containing protein [Anaerosphaera multitolerans]|uniref:DUF1015 domain-containing protein n=1 Tax=Anaerosphaera multitolerans TaxID=2487351 RepID=A0A437S4Y6_9FIRM|nr:DUF1015 family protein [Anaerosphaera multitolerans]RVU54037.1 DUF1015 domain-containing protein [Anaerosphaera multitolerans]
MIELKAFKALRPSAKYVDKITVPPYDVLSEEDIKEYAKDKNSMIHVIRSEVNFKEIDPYSIEVYESARDYLKDLLDRGVIFEDDEALYIYTETLGGKSQSGIVGLVNVKNYIEKDIKVHELTLKEKELDRTNHFYHMKVQDEPVFLFHKRNEELKNLLLEYFNKNAPVVDFDDEFEVNHKLHKIDDRVLINKIEKIFKDTDNLYIADGHHRTASIATVCKKLREEGEKSGESNYLMATIFPEDELNILAYNRVVKDLNGITEEEFLNRLKDNFKVTKLSSVESPKTKNNFTLILKDSCYNIEYIGERNFSTYAESLDVSILQDYILESVLDIKDIRTDKRIEFYGGFTSEDKIIDKIEKGYALGILLYPVSSKDIIEISNRDEIMPPKSTWFEPKLRSGLFMHKLI